MARPDLTVRGGGIFGLCIAYETARRGARVRLIEAHAIGGGASGGVVGALAPHVPESWNAKKQFQLDSLLIAPTFWNAIAQTANLPTGYARTGRLQPIPDEAALTVAHQRSLTAATLWQDHARWTVIPTTNAPWQLHSPTGYLIHDSLTARIHPILALTALAAALRAHGGEIIIGNAPDQGPVIWATGTDGLNDLNTALARKIGSGVKGQALTLRHHAAHLPQLLIDGLHIVPHDDGTVAIGSTSEPQWTDATSTDALLDALLQKARAALPILQNAPVLQRWAALRPRATSRAPLLGNWPHRPGHYIANGGFKIGFGMAPKVAQVMVDLVLDQHDTIPADFRMPDG